VLVSVRDFEDISYKLSDFRKKKKKKKKEKEEKKKVRVWP
jgi:hypothetical protein